MKRYRVLNFTFDARANILNIEVLPTWKANIRERMLTNQQQIRDQLAMEFGQHNIETKIKDFRDMGASPVSMVFFHNKFINQCRNAFVLGSYYPSLVSSCTLAERILNHLLLRLRNHYTESPEYKSVFNKKSFDNWKIPISSLLAWDVLSEETSDMFVELYKIRNKSVHFNPETDTNTRDLALSAIHTLQNIINRQFSPIETQPWRIMESNVPFVSKSHESIPFVKEVVLPNCKLVGPHHRLELGRGGWIVHDNSDYPDIEISDVEFASLYSDSIAKNPGK